ncbi:purine-binding chemotaxis protein CheW [Rhizobium leguminosarum]|uniref:Purine-binding chemotaxis protein CheW n=1 Tax=Rhizobium leguminosarum TaxID=384 RepID=A0AAE2SZX0_RHILE|nr:MULTISPECIES: chemotaxis protein CheW [Rhizobium]MBB4293860.1 purine-binding chemotaxis protein CheW [Rhizobium leguminosarum]MBB4300529.1 purine-binding chemotaxis protein CheW [Rhizobium leguminosarum]MBB4311824.1 purine-binding chemotaxis protein CheW [Rhizobium leguminosarum]MBB4420535.1 purine-binding chemotaxis protein CheW [Rhizobium leguminosarum]MBB4436032.1 purine-binding chemotaxis protein CheW [Rhizobium esperanzae]
MNDLNLSATTMLEIIAFHLGDQQFCIRTTSIREIRGWAAATPLPHAPPYVLGVMNLRGSVIPVIDLAAKLGVLGAVSTERSAIVVAEIGNSIIGLVVDRVSDILSISSDRVQPVPHLGTSFDPAFSYGIIPLEQGMVCFLNLDHMFGTLEQVQSAA